jgi:hypothetical protein
MATNMSLRYTSNLSLDDAQLSMPRDTRSPRSKVSLRRGSPSALVFNVLGRRIQMPIETAEDYRDYILH